MSALYDNGRNEFAKGNINWKATDGDVIRVCLVKAAYTPDLANHTSFSNLGANVVGNSGLTTRASCPQLTLIDPIAGICDASDVTFTTPTAGITCNYICIFKDTGADATSTLIALIDAGLGLPIVTNGADINLTWSNETNKIFKL